MSNNDKKEKPPIFMIIGGVTGLAILLFAAYSLFSLMLDSKPATKKKVVQEVTIIRPPPPPPPEEEPPPPEEIEEEIVEEELVSEEIPQEAAEPLVGDLGLDADGVAGGDSFGLVGRKGGKGLFGGGGTYAALIQQEITDLLIDDQKLRSHEFVLTVRLWIDNFGKIKKYEIVRNKGTDKDQTLLEKALVRLGKISQPPPLEQPQPIKLRIRSQF